MKKKINLMKTELNGTDSMAVNTRKRADSDWVVFEPKYQL